MAKALSEAVKALRCAQDADAIEDALKGVVADSVVDVNSRRQLCVLLDGFLADEARWNVTAKLRRKLKRTLEIYGVESTCCQVATSKPIVSVDASIEGAEAEVVSAASNPAPIDWDALAHSVRASISAEELEGVLTSKSVQVIAHRFVKPCLK